MPLLDFLTGSCGLIRSMFLKGSRLVKLQRPSSCADRASRSTAARHDGRSPGDALAGSVLRGRHRTASRPDPIERVNDRIRMWRDEPSLQAPSGAVVSSPLPNDSAGRKTVLETEEEECLRGLRKAWRCAVAVKLITTLPSVGHRDRRRTISCRENPGLGRPEFSANDFKELRQTKLWSHRGPRFFRPGF